MSLCLCLWNTQKKTCLFTYKWKMVQKRKLDSFDRSKISDWFYPCYNNQLSFPFSPFSPLVHSQSLLFYGFRKIHIYSNFSMASPKPAFPLPALTLNASRNLLFHSLPKVCILYLSILPTKTFAHFPMASWKSIQNYLLTRRHTTSIGHTNFHSRFSTLVHSSCFPLLLYIKVLPSHFRI